MLTLATRQRTAASQPASGRHLHALQIGMRWGHSAGVGGLDRVFMDLVRFLPQAGVDVSGVVEGPETVAALTAGGVRSFSAPGASMLRRYLGARKTIDDTLSDARIDLVATHFALFTALALDRIRRRPLVVHFHGPWWAEAAAEGAGRPAIIAKRAIEGTVYRCAERVIVLSRSFGELVVSEFGVAADRVRVVPGSVDIGRFACDESKAEARRRLGLPADRPIVLTLRRLARRMGLDRLIDAMVAVVRAEPEVLLCVGGKGSLRPALEQQVRAAGLQRHVRFLGFVAEETLPMLYRAADLNVVPSVKLEGFGLVAAEALAAGTPSLVSPVGGLPEVVAPLSPALVLPSAATTDIAAGLIAALRGHMALPDEAACRAYAAACFPAVLAAERVAAIYREVA